MHLHNGKFKISDLSQAFDIDAPPAEGHCEKVLSSIGERAFPFVAPELESLLNDIALTAKCDVYR